MSKKLFLICLVALTFSFSARSQYVTIPDTNFANWLQIHFSSCMTGNQLDTTCSALHSNWPWSYYDMDLSNLCIHDLTGIKYFDGCRILHCDNNPLKHLPPLPNTLRSLICQSDSLIDLPVLPDSLGVLSCNNNQLTSLPALPNKLDELFCAQNQLTSLPTLPDSLRRLSCGINNLNTLPMLPNKIYELNCRINQLTSLPALPNSIQDLECNSNHIISLPNLPISITRLDCSVNDLHILPNLPNSLNYLNCMADSLTSLPLLPDSLKYLCVSGNQITSFPLFPSGLTTLLIDDCQLTSLPIIPNTLTTLGCGYNTISNLPALPNSLQILSCDHNLLTNLPTLPNSLLKLYCRNNQLNSLPELPNTLNYLDCRDNSISCFPVFPISIDIYYPFNQLGLFISGNLFTCLPNYVSGMEGYALSFPLCKSNDTVNNPNGCLHASGIFGKIFKDNDSNCIMNNNDVGCYNVHLKLYDSLNNLIAQTYSLPYGVYNFIDSVGTYRVELDTAGVPFLPLCTSPGIDSIIDLTITTPYVDDVNFGIVCKPGFDLGVLGVNHNGLVFPGIQHCLQISAGDMTNWYNLNCTAGISGQVQLTVNGPVVFNGIPNGALVPLIAGNVFTYNISDFGTSLNQHGLALLFTVNTNAQFGDSICVDAVVTPSAGDYNPGNNSYHICYSILNSFDPNMKEVFPQDVRPGFHDYFTYTIHFQNTGNAPAINIKLVDTISNELDMETFQLINYSHYNITSLDKNVLTIRFPNIQLPDSASDEEGSKGFVQYRIKPKASWAIGSVIKNTAWIYFDYNAPIATNTTINEYITTGINENKEEIISLKIYPNPFNAEATVQFNKKVSDAALIIFDMLGQKLKAIDHISGDKVIINRGNISSGIYFIRLMQDNKIIAAGKIIITG
jgi:uncharacterized repeat protein (TIGR01451 family)